MHISEGVLPAAVLAAGWGISAIGIWRGLKDMSLDDAAVAGVSTAGFFVASLIHVPIGPSSVHLILNGLVGILLGWAAYPAIFVALLLQAILFQFGGVAVLGCNALIMGIPAVIIGMAARRALNLFRMPPWLIGVLCGGTSVAFSALLLALVLGAGGEAFALTARVAFVAHIPVMIAEAAITGGIMTFFAKVAPDIVGLREVQDE